MRPQIRRSTIAARSGIIPEHRPRQGFSLQLQSCLYPPLAESTLAHATVICLAVRETVHVASSASTLRRKTILTIMRRMASESRRSQMLRGVLDLCLLAVVIDEPAYGYEMTKRLRDRGLAIVGEGSIYPLLGRLERDGLVETYRAASNGGPPRKYYRPSGAGRVALAMGVSEWRAARDAVDAVLAPVKLEEAS